MRYVPRLDDAQIAEAWRQNHALWSSGRSLEEHLRYNREQLDRAGPEMLRYVGLLDDPRAIAADVAAVVALHAEGFADAPSVVRIARTPATLRYFAWRNRTGPAQVLLDDGGRAVGYAIAARDDPMRDLPELRGDALWLDE